MTAPLLLEPTDDGRILRLTLNTPPANIVDAAMMAALDEALVNAVGDPKLAAVILDHAGKHFSFGASVAEHLPGKFEGMIRGFHALCRRMATFPVPILAAVGGQCLGGGMELVLLASRLFAGPRAKFGQPEIQLGVFAPVASVLLPRRVRPGRAEDLLTSGRSIGVQEAATWGLVHAVEEDPAAAALAWAREQLLPRSSFALRQAVAAARQSWLADFETDLKVVEERYLNTLMSGADPVEGLTAFVEKRDPAWRHA